MKKKSRILIYTFVIVGMFLMLMSSCKKDEDEDKKDYTVFDIDGNGYTTVTIGTQVWMVENLKTTKYRDGSAIPNAIDNQAWLNSTAGAYCNYNNDANYSKIYGRLYNWYAVNNSRNIAPTGWHVATDDDWMQLTGYLGGESVSDGKLKEIGTTHWSSPNTGATNETGFTALPGGQRTADGAFHFIGVIGIYWSTAYSGPNAYLWSMQYDASYVFSAYADKRCGHSVRCVRDQPAP